MKQKILLLITIIFVSVTSLSAQKTAYIKKYKPIAEKLSKEYGIPSSVILSIAGLESGWGTSRVSKKYNNHFGIKGRNLVEKSRYKSFSSGEACYRHFCGMISRKKYYKKMKGNKDAYKWINVIGNHGYSTIPEIWKKRVKQVLKSNNY